MANVNNFGLVGVGSNVQFGKAGARVVNNAGTFNLKAANGSTDAALTTAGITSSAGNITLTTGNLVASAGDVVATLGNLTLSTNTATVSIGDAGTLSRQAAGVYKFSGTAATMIPVGSTGQQPTGVTGMVRLNNDTTPVLEYYNGTVWTQVSGTSALQTEIDNIEASLGPAIGTDGTFNAGGFTTNAAVTAATSFTNAINQLSAYAVAHDTLEEIFPQTGAGNVIYSNGTTWLQAGPGATSGVQAWDAKLDALSIFDTTGIMVQTGVDTFAGRTLIAPAAGITITDPAGIAGNPTFALANDLAALEGLATTGYIVRTGDGTATTRSIAGTAGNIVVTNGSGVASDTSVDLATVSQAATGDFVKVTLDGFGRVTGNTAVVAADITALVSSIYVDVAGDTMTGSLVMSTGTHITLPDAPVNDTDAANKAYVDATAAGLTWKTAVLAATTANITLSGPQTIDGVAVIAGNRVLVKNQTAGQDNGIYIVAAGAWTRSTDADSPSELDSAAVFVQQGTAQADTGWTQTATIITVGTTPQTWVQFSGANAYIGGIGIDITGNTISVNLGAGITQLPSDEVGIDVVAGKAVQLTGLATGDQLTFVLDGGAASGLEQSASGLKISAAGVTNAMLVNPSIGLNGDAGTSTVALGQTLQVIGTSVQGISTSVAGQTVTLTAANASSSQKGVATFNTASFAVTAGDVTIKAGGVTNAQLVNSSITMTGDTGSDAVALGESFDFNGDSTFITTNVAANVVSFTLGTVDVPHGGTGAGTLLDTAVLIGNGAAAVEATTALTFVTDTLRVGGTAGLSLQGDGTDATISVLAVDGDLVLLPNGTGSVIVGPTGAGLIQSDVAETLTVRGNAGLILESVGADTTMLLPGSTAFKVTVSGPTAVEYATGLAAEDLPNVQYVTDAIATGASAGAIKAVSAVVSLVSAGSTNIGALLPAGATILSVKVNVTAADTGTGTLIVGKTGGNQYMTVSENDTQTTGIYIAEDMVIEAGAVQVQATVAGTPAGAGSATVIVEYKVAG